jgi:hypothetical protein
MNLLTIATTLSAAAAFTSTSSLVARRSQSLYCPALHSTYSSLEINVNELAERDMNTFEQWAESVGIQKPPGVILKPTDRYMKNVHLTTSQDVLAGPVLYVPEEIILSSNKAMAAYRTRVMEPAEKQLQTFDAMSELRQYYLMLQLLVEIERGSERYDDHEMCREKFCKSIVLYLTYYVCFAPNQQSMVSMAKLPTTLLRKRRLHDLLLRQLSPPSHAQTKRTRERQPTMSIQPSLL